MQRISLLCFHEDYLYTILSPKQCPLLLLENSSNGLKEMATSDECTLKRIPLLFPNLCQKFYFFNDFHFSSRNTWNLLFPNRSKPLCCRAEMFLNTINICKNLDFRFALQTQGIQLESTFLSRTSELMAWNIQWLLMH